MTNETLVLDFGTKDQRTWNMDLSNFPVFFPDDGSEDGFIISTLYGQVVIGDDEFTQIEFDSVEWKLKEN